MITELGTLKAGLFMSGKFLVPALSPVIAETVGLINENTVLPLTVVGVVGGGLWYIKGWMDDVTNRLKNLEQAEKESRVHHQMICPVGYKYPDACSAETGQPKDNAKKLESAD